MKNDKKGLSVSERHFGVILEDIDAKLYLVLEGHQSLDIKIDKNHQEFQEFREEVNYKFDVVFEKFDEIDIRFKNIDIRFDAIDIRFKDVDARFDNVEAEFKNVKDELRVIHDELKEKPGRDEFTLLEKRTMALEKSRK